MIIEDLSDIPLKPNTTVHSNHFLISLSFQVYPQQQPAETPTEFAPHVTATCKSGAMNIRIQFASAYSGAVHARDFRNPSCMTFGNGSTTVGMSLNLLAKQGQSDYCGILVSNVSGDVRLFNTTNISFYL